MQFGKEKIAVQAEKYQLTGRKAGVL